MAHLTVNADFSLVTIPGGATGTRTTLRAMKELCTIAKTSALIRTTAADLVQPLASHNFTAEARAVFGFVRDNIRYLRDVDGVETLQTPAVTLTQRRGDCDDMATLLASLLLSIGHPVRFTAIAYAHPGQYDHVIVDTLIADNWVSMDATGCNDFGWAPMPPWTSDPVFGIMREYC